MDAGQFGCITKLKTKRLVLEGYFEGVTISNLKWVLIYVCARVKHTGFRDSFSCNKYRYNNGLAILPGKLGLGWITVIMRPIKCKLVSDTKKGICYCRCLVVYHFLEFCSYCVPKSLTQPFAQAKNGDKQF